MADRMKEKLENILYYHKAKILAGVAAAALLLYAAAVPGGGSADTALYGESVNVRLSSEEIEQVCEAGSHALGLDAGKVQPGTVVAMIAAGIGYTWAAEAPEPKQG